ncbi:hypothetical protein GCQ56_07635 [Marinifilum sp. N1E240]|uniref:hypothetical protein n=1 Tax=Marinifilum sp. N1E240 TaxID=2608082 RepID=UPI00128B8CB9|nr:hypothetical protein [Marinifilum sp. N1E240]MPQ46884.1 hypothetical protein [Marinifilum sp. N1E240]
MEDKEIELEDLLKKLDKGLDIIIKDYSKVMLETYGLYSYDLFCSAILNRSINTIRGYTLLMRDKNFLSAAPLVRIQIDSLLRIFASTIISFNVDDFALKVIGGKQINQLKDDRGKKMSDNYLCDRLSKNKTFSWVKDAYKAGCGYVHFSNNVTSKSVRKGGGRKIEGIIQKNDDFVSMEEKINSARIMLATTKGILLFISSWTKQKESYNHIGSQTPKA